MRHFWNGAAALALAATGAVAQDSALVIGNSDYRDIADVRYADRVVHARRGLSGEGFQVFVARDAPMDRMVASLRGFLSDLDVQSRRAVVILAGQFVNSGQETYFLSKDTRRPMDLMEMQANGIALSLILAALDDYPGNAVLLLGEGQSSGQAGPRLQHGIGQLDIPQGVTVVRGEPRRLAAFASGDLLSTDGNIWADARSDHGLTVEGFVPSGGAARADVPKPIPKPTPKPYLPDQTDDQAWKEAVQGDNLASYRRYLTLYPNGRHAQQARDMMKEIRNEPFRADRKAEEALKLTRNDRRRIQRNLTLLGFDTRGIDGIFGRGSRAGISKWQGSNGQRATGYLTGNQITKLHQQARVRAAELEEEARLKREAEERRDRAYWRDTGAFGDFEGLTAYIEKYPDGVYAEEAQAQLAAIQEERRQRAAAKDRRAWQRAESGNTAEDYQDYLNAFPEGAYVGEAKARYAALSRSAEEIAAERRAIEAENALRLNRSTRRLIEMRLGQIGLKPGAIDGEFDDATRRAIRRYQNARGLPPTGFMNQNTVALLLVEAIGR